MKIQLKLKENPLSFMRQCGYAPLGQRGGELEFVRVIGSSVSGYPRFHAYVKVGEFSREITINLHLDQKKPVYRGAPAHGAEYEGEIVEKEAARIQKIIKGR